MPGPRGNLALGLAQPELAPEPGFIGPGGWDSPVPWAHAGQVSQWTPGPQPMPPNRTSKLPKSKQDLSSIPAFGDLTAAEANQFPRRWLAFPPLPRTGQLGCEHLAQKISRHDRMWAGHLQLPLAANCACPK